MVVLFVLFAVQKRGTGGIGRFFGPVTALWFGVLALMVVKALCIYGVARLAKSQHGDALDRAVLMAQGGEFAFVLYAAAAAVGIIDATSNAILTAIIIVSMVLTPIMVILHDRFRRAPEVSLAGMEAPMAQELRGLPRRIVGLVQRWLS